MQQFNDIIGEIRDEVASVKGCIEQLEQSLEGGWKNATMIQDNASLVFAGGMTLDHLTYFLERVTSQVREDEARARVYFGVPTCKPEGAEKCPICEEWKAYPDGWVNRPERHGGLRYVCGECAERFVEIRESVPVEKVRFELKETSHDGGDIEAG